jgi:hypothetical protein
LTTFLFSQTPENEKEITLTGKVIDQTTKQPLEYATIILKNTKTQKYQEELQMKTDYSM